MCRFVESLRIEGGIAHNLGYHQARLDATRAEVLGLRDRIVIAGALPKLPKDGKWKCRVLYDEKIERVEIAEYIPRRIESFRLVYDDEIGYSYKSTNRERLKELYERRGKSDDILIVQHGLITDSFSANVILFNGVEWVTPARPLLRGTMRQELMESGKVIERDIRVEDLREYRYIMPINAMLPFDEGRKVGIEKISR